VKRQQIISSFLPGVTLAVLTVQPSLANAKDNEAKLLASSNALTSTSQQINTVGHRLLPSQCKIPNVNSSSLLPCSPASVLPKRESSSGKRVAQAPTPTSISQAAPTTPATAPIPDYLNPQPNPLQFPTKPEEVRILGTQPVTLDQALQLARSNNRQLQVALLQLERSQFALREARSALYPNINLSTTLTRQQSAQSQLAVEAEERRREDLSPQQREALEAQQPLSPDEPSTIFNGGPELSYNIYTSGARRARIEQAEEQVRFNLLEVEQLSEEIALNVSTQYYNLQQADELVRIAEVAVENAQVSLRDAQALEQAGVGTRFDVLQAQVDLANAQQQLTNALSDQRITRRQLANLLSLSQVVNIAAADPVQIAGLWNPTLEETIILAFQNRPELQQELAERNINQQQVREALAALGPQLGLNGQYNLLDEFDDNVGATDGYSLQLQASLLLFDGGAARARANQARANVRIDEVQFAQQRNDIRFEVEQAYSQLQANLENIQTANTALEQATEALRLARLRFQAGVGTQLEVINQQNRLTQAQGNQVQAVLDYNRALAQLRRAVTSRSLR
jgi:outer membrane protein TolC